MDLVPWDDPEISRGIQMLEGKTTVVNERMPKTRRSHREEEEPNPGKPVGLEIGRKLVVVVNKEESSQHSSSNPQTPKRPTKDVDGGQKVLVIEHGGTQKEAVRRLFDAQVLLKSYETHMESYKSTIADLQKTIQKLARKQISGEDLRALAEDGRPIKYPVESNLVQRMVPGWMRHDNETRKAIEERKRLFLIRYEEEGKTLREPQLVDMMWQVGMDFAIRWGGDIQEEQNRKVEAAEASAFKAKRDCLEETMTMRNHLKALERKNNDLVEHTRVLKAELAAKISILEKTKRQLANAMAANAMSGQRVPSKQPIPFGGGGHGGRLHTKETNSGHSGFQQMTQREDGQIPMCEVCGQNTSTMWGWSFEAEGEDGEAMSSFDNEHFEPLKQFDEETQELLIDMVNAKVRRIIQLDHTKFKNGVLPFGIRPDPNDDGTLRLKIAELEEELKKLRVEMRRKKDLVDELTEENERLRQLLGMKHPGSRQLSKPSSTHDAAGHHREKLVKESPTDDGKDQLIASLQAEIERLKALLKEKDDELERQRKLLKELEDQIKELLNAQEKTRAEHAKMKSQVEHEKAQKAQAPPGAAHEKLKRPGPDEICPLCGRGPPKEVQEKPPQVIIKEVIVEKVVADKDPDAGFLRAMSGMHQQLHHLLTQQSEELGLPKTSSRRVGKLLGDHTPDMSKRPSKDSKSANDLQQVGALLQTNEVLDAYAKWSEEVMNASHATSQAASSAVHKELAPPIDSSRGGNTIDKAAYDDLMKKFQDTMAENKRLTKQLKEAQDEIARLLLIIDELRKRIQQLMDAAGEHGEDVRNIFSGIMGRAGLRDMLGKSSSPKLSGVFERLYQDAVQRIQRSGLVRERYILASQAYHATIGSVKEGKLNEPLVDLVQLNETTAAALKGMWYHTDRLFSHCCEYAMSQGLEACIQRGVHPTLEEILEAANDVDVIAKQEDDDSLGEDLGSTPEKVMARQRTSEAERALRRQRRPVAGTSRRSPVPSFPGTEGAKAFWHPLPGGLLKSNSPRELRQQIVEDPANTPFSRYVAAMKEARNELRHDDWPQSKPQVDRQPRNGDMIGFIVGRGNGYRGSSPMTKSESLPLLPKGRSVVQAVNDLAMSTDDPAAM